MQCSAAASAGCARLALLVWCMPNTGIRQPCGYICGQQFGSCPHVQMATPSSLSSSSSARAGAAGGFGQEHGTTTGAEGRSQEPAMSSQEPSPFPQLLRRVKAQLTRMRCAALWGAANPRKLMLHLGVQGHCHLHPGAQAAAASQTSRTAQLSAAKHWSKDGSEEKLLYSCLQHAQCCGLCRAANLACACAGRSRRCWMSMLLRAGGAPRRRQSDPTASWHVRLLRCVAGHLCCAALCMLKPVSTASPYMSGMLDQRARYQGQAKVVASSAT